LEIINTHIISKNKLTDMDLKHCIPVLFVKDAKLSRNFYENLLEFTVTGDFGGLNIVFEEGLAIWQIMDGNIIIEKLGADNITDSQLTSRCELAFDTSDLDTIYRKLKDAGVKFLHEINTEIWGQRNMRFYDPDGHLIEVGEEMHVFLRRIYDEENKDMEATAKRTYMQPDILKSILGL